MKIIRGYDYIENGHGMPLIMLHGVVGCAKHFRGIMPFLPADCRGIALNFPFFDDAHSIASLNDATGYVRGFIDRLGEEKVVLMGNSFGGHVALHLALNMPDRVAGLVLTGSSGLLERSFGAPPSSRPDSEWIRRTTCAVFHDERIATDEMLSEVCQLLSCRDCVRRLLGLFRSIRKERLHNRLAEIECPVQLIWGRQDRVTPPATAMEFHTLLPNSELDWIDKCGHVPMLEAPHTFATLLRQWWHRNSQQLGIERIAQQERLPA